MNLFDTVIGGLLGLGVVVIVLTGIICIVRYIIAFTAHQIRLFALHYLDTAREIAAMQQASVTVNGVVGKATQTAQIKSKPAIDRNDGMAALPHTTTSSMPAATGVACSPVSPSGVDGVVPTFRDLTMAKRIRGGEQFVLGWQNGEPALGTWQHLYSTLIGGVIGSGKTSTARFLLTQAAVKGAQFVVIDPHGEVADESLAATMAPLSCSMLCEPAIESKRMSQVLRMVDRIGRKRIQGDTDRTPIILAVDEVTALLSRSDLADQLDEVLRTIAQEYRKVNVFALCMGQIWTAESMGGSSSLRDSFASAYVHRLKRSQARLLLPTEEAKLCERLAVGQVMLWRTTGEVMPLAIPFTTQEDVVAVGKWVRKQQKTKQAETKIADVKNGEGVAIPTSQNGVMAPMVTSALTSSPYSDPTSIATSQNGHFANFQRDGSGGEAEKEAALEAPNSALSVKAARVRRMLLEGCKQKEILEEVWGVTGGGRAYQEAAAEFYAILQTLLK